MVWGIIIASSSSSNGCVSFAMVATLILDHGAGYYACEWHRMCCLACVLAGYVWQFSCALAQQAT
jgi:hypothetical protein